MLLFIKQNLSLCSSIMDFSNFFLKSILSIKKWIQDSKLIGFRFPNQIWILDSIIVDSGFQQPDFARFRILLQGSNSNHGYSLLIYYSPFFDCSVFLTEQSKNGMHCLIEQEALTCFKSALETYLNNRTFLSHFYLIGLHPHL